MTDRLDDSKESFLKSLKLAAQWPKEHKCKAAGGATVFITEADWAKLPLAVNERLGPDGRNADDFCTLEYRNCSCGSTLAVMVAIHDLSAE